VKSNFNFSEAAFNNIYKAFNRNEISFNKIKKILSSIVGIEPKLYDMCVNSCCAFVGVLENETRCRFCKEPRYYSNGKARKYLPFISIIERLKLQFKNSERSKELLYRHNYTYNEELVHENIGDIFDGLVYKELLNEEYFPNPRDVAFTASCDGYQIFRQKTDDCWVFLFLNNNLPQELRVKKENLMVALIVPGPKQPQDFNSFLFPLIQEMKILEGIIKNVKKIIIKYTVIFINLLIMFIYLQTESLVTMVTKKKILLCVLTYWLGPGISLLFQKFYA
jgi:hypothetical protein